MKSPATPSPSKSPRKFNSERFWRHYVATDAQDPVLMEEDKKGGHASRIFIFLLLLHAFLIGSVVLYNLVAERPRPAFVDATQPAGKSGDTGKGATPRSLTVGKTMEYVVATGNTLKDIADKTGATQEEIVFLNGLDKGNDISVGKRLLVPDRRSTKPAPPAEQAVTATQTASPTESKTGRDQVVAVQTTTKPGSMDSFHGTEPNKGTTDTKNLTVPPVKLDDKLPEKTQAVSPRITTPVQDKLPEAQKTAKKGTEESLPAAKTPESKPAETKAAPKVAEVKKPVEPAAKPAETKPAVAKTNETAKPAEAKLATAKPADSKPDPEKKLASVKPPETKPTPPKPAPAKPTGGGISHVVKSGDTPYRLGKKYGVSAEQIMKYNGIKDASKLRLGQVLKIPPKS